MVIGITGPSGAGKSLFCGFFRECGFRILDCDEIYHGMVSSPSDCTAEISLPENFGTSVLSPDGSLDRAALAAVVFAPGAEDKLLRLNEITHKYVHAEILRLISGLPDDCPGAVVDAPLLFQAGFDADCDLTVSLLAPENIRVARLLCRDGISEEKIRARLDSAPNDVYYISRSDIVFRNDGDADALKKQALSVIEYARQKSMCRSALRSHRACGRKD
ncbi:MAG: dephospho-CoA kinase [Clostridia bacterium]|nr:dephospho-CoA kinase [Clostridia bacterium]